MTNFEKIKQMSVEEFVKLIGGNGLCNHIQDYHGEFCERHSVCDECCKEWLESEADTEQREGERE